MSSSTCPLSPSPHSPPGHMAFLKPSHATHVLRRRAPVPTIFILSLGVVLEVALGCGVLQTPSSSPLALSGFSALPSPVSSIPCIQYPLLKGPAGCQFPGLDLDCTWAHSEPLCCGSHFRTHNGGQGKAKRGLHLPWVRLRPGSSSPTCPVPGSPPPSAASHIPCCDSDSCQRFLVVRLFMGDRPATGIPGMVTHSQKPRFRDHYFTKD